MGKIDISLLVAFSFTPTALLKPCSLICPLFLPVFFFFPVALSLCLIFSFFLNFIFLNLFFCYLQTFFFLTPTLSSLSVSVPLTTLTPLLCEDALYKQCCLLLYSGSFSHRGQSMTHTFYQCKHPLMPPLNASLAG